MKALIAEDESLLACNIKELLESELLEGLFDRVDIVDNGAAALRLIQDFYDLLILDLRMPEVDGTRVIEALSDMPPEKKPSVILITAYPADYETARLQIRMGVQALLHKPFELVDLMGLVKELMDLRRQLLHFKDQGSQKHCRWTLGLSDAGLASVHVGGLLRFADNCRLQWDPSDLAMLSRRVDVASAMIGAPGVLHDNWRMVAKEVGHALFQKLFVERIVHSFVAAGSMVLQPHDLKLTFVCAREHLHLPLEFLSDGSDFLALCYPMKRFITGVYSKRIASFSNLLAELRDKRERLRILLIASNTRPAIDGVDEEIEAVGECIRRHFPVDRVKIDCLPTEKASYEAVLRRLEGCSYHLVHYAGHGLHDPLHPDKSSLVFWESEGSRGELIRLSISALRNTLRRKGHSLQFVYLSCCKGTASSGREALFNDNFLGIADGLIQADVPSVLGFRWGVSDQGAKAFACAFYESLFEQGHLDTAAFSARCKVAAGVDGPDLGDWLSPILIMQDG